FSAVAVVVLVHWAWRGRVASQDGFEMIVFAVTAIAVAAFLFVLVSRRINTPNLMVGGLCYWLVFLCLTVFLAPGASYLFMWPLLFNLAALAYVFASKHPSVKHLAVLALCALPGVVLFVP